MKFQTHHLKGVDWIARAFLNIPSTSSRYGGSTVSGLGSPVKCGRFRNPTDLPSRAPAELFATKSCSDCLEPEAKLSHTAPTRLVGDERCEVISRLSFIVHGCLAKDVAINFRFRIVPS